MRFSIFLLVLLFTACQNPPVEDVPTEPADTGSSNSSDYSVVSNDKNPVNEQADTVIQNNDAFSLYHPAGLRINAGTRAIVFFDPHGDGTHPLRLYRNLADEFGVVLMGSNKSRNGMSLEESLKIAGELVGKAMEMGVPEKNITLCGFSGGAKVALYTAHNRSGIKKVIYCGAALNMPLREDLALLGFAGRLDMNYTDLVQFEWYLQNQPHENYFVEWAGDHRFPDAEVFHDGFRFATGKPLNLKGKEVTISQSEIAGEQKKKRYLYNALLEQDMAWWEGVVQKMNSDPTPMNQRLLGFISLTCYSVGNRAAEQKNTAVLEKIIPIYRAVDPESEGPGELAVKLEELRL